MAEAREIDKLIDEFSGDFESRPTYSAEGDCVEFYFEDADGFAERVDCWLTVYRAFDDKRVTGFMLKNIRGLLSAFDSLGLEYHAKGKSYRIRIHKVFTQVPWVAPESSQNNCYRDVLSRLRDRSNETVDLVQA